MKQILTPKTTCRACVSSTLEKVLSFGPTPLANAFLTQKQLNEPELFFPLDVYFCHTCNFLQLGHVVAPEVLFKNYVYVSSTSPVFVAHFEEYARQITKRFTLNKNSLVIDIGSNDGILLQPFLKRGIQVLGVEPAKHIAQKANKRGIRTIVKFFDNSSAKFMLTRYGKADVITANNVFAHIDNLDSVIEGVRTLLKIDGIFVVEAPYLIDFLVKNYFDLVYHEHLSYISVRPLQILFKRLGMEIFDVQKSNVHGGSIRVFTQTQGGSHKITPNVAKFIALEKNMKLHSVDMYKRYASVILKNKSRLVGLLTKIKLMGKSIAGYGAPAKGNTLLNYFSIGTDFLDYIIDDSPLKQNLYTPGRHIPVLPAYMLTKHRPDYLLILAWNFAEPIIANLGEYSNAGGKFIIPVPRPRIV